MLLLVIMFAAIFFMAGNIMTLNIPNLITGLF